jgi:hypothetical protein
MKLLAIANLLPKEEKRKEPKTLGQLAHQLNIGFQVYRMVMRDSLKDTPPIRQEEMSEALNETHTRLRSYWDIAFTPNIKAGYRLKAKDLSDSFLSAAVGKFSEEFASQINGVSDRAFSEGYNAALNKGWDRSLAWQKVADAWGLDPVQMRSWITYYPADGYHPHSHPKKSEKQLEDFFSIRGKRIGEHEARTLSNLGMQADWSYKQSKGLITPSMKKVYRTAQDELVCPTCGPLDGIEVDISDQFAGFFMPPLHINCRCEVELAYDIVTKAESLTRQRSVKRNTGRGKALQRGGPGIAVATGSPVKQAPKKIEYELPEVVESEYDTPVKSTKKETVSQEEDKSTKVSVSSSVKPEVKPEVKPATKAKEKSGILSAFAALAGQKEKPQPAVKPSIKAEDKVIPRPKVRTPGVVGWSDDKANSARRPKSPPSPPRDLNPWGDRRPPSHTARRLTRKTESLG